MSQASPSMQRLAEIDARAARCGDAALQSDVVCLVRVISSLLAMHAPVGDGRCCGECQSAVPARRRRVRPPAPCRTRWLLEVVLGRG